jgi:hypothetical protein
VLLFEYPTSGFLMLMTAVLAGQLPYIGAWKRCSLEMLPYHGLACKKHALGINSGLHLV